MDISWIIFIGASLFLAWRGFRQGPWLALSRFVSLLAAYAVAIRFSQSAADNLANYLPIGGLAGRIAAGLLLFFGTAFLVSGLFTLLDKLLSQGQAGVRRSFAGALVGAAVGSLFGLAGVLAASYLQDLGEAKKGGGLRQPGVLEITARKVAGKTIETFGGLGMNESTSRLGAALVRDPVAVVGNLQQLAQNPEARQLFSSPEGQSALASGDARAIASLPSFSQLADTPEMQALMESAGIGDSENREQVLAEQLAGAWERVESVRGSPRMDEILNDPELREKLANGDTLSLLADPRLAEILEIFRGEDSAPVASSSDREAAGKSARKPADIYQWRDADGQLHMSDTPPPQ
ncbi:DUF4124 domain-containing protein [Proteobacteria bacterium 005FR1]|nr:DUF4124 domain-containing protein [Proteobacteria bacterium 005FR1]